MPSSIVIGDVYVKTRLSIHPLIKYLPLFIIIGSSKLASPCCRISGGGVSYGFAVSHEKGVYLFLRGAHSAVSPYVTAVAAVAGRMMLIPKKLVNRSAQKHFRGPRFYQHIPAGKKGTEVVISVIFAVKLINGGVKSIDKSLVLVRCPFPFVFIVGLGNQLLSVFVL